MGSGPQGLRISRLISRCQETINHPKEGGPELRLFRTTSLLNKKAFTLIELLVVVLIIGILAAVAIPQYQIARDKAAVTCIMPLLRSIAQAHQVLYMEHSGWPKKADGSADYFHFADLPISMTITNEEKCRETDACNIKCSGKSYTVLLRNGETWANFDWSGRFARLI